ncbi:hypothetical protein GCM10009677_22020 [Sphaerisporangium rubeum]|uniref:Lipid droplet-associated protein n=1 Tax=Sphaerisporangium rubeum TaxID=321317 RepID=A0A7X0IJC0_9ACTN|nr:hypothetical protein [Sphaerisporangium rubeum]MBB6476279.1 hypothetical protein [Sphaerisporangium rubeum]
MSLTDIVRTVAKNVRQTVSDPGELKEKAKDLPLNVLQTAVAGVGQALMLSDRVRTRLRNLVTGREPEEDKPAAEHETWATATEEPSAKPARREPVIFAPRPSPAQPDPSPTTPDPSTSATPAAGAPTTPVETAASVTPVEATAPATPAEDITPAVPTPAKPAETVAAAPAEPAAGPPATAAEPVSKDATAAAPLSTDAVATTPSTDAAPTTTLPEPLPGYAGLTLASLRARLRGKTVEQVRDLLAYEQATTARPEVVQMFTKRLAKMESGE